MKVVAQNKFTNRLQEKDFLIMAHRGFWGGNVIQNTRQAAIMAKKVGADVIEVDICRSSDGVYYLFHNGNEPALLGVLAKDFSELSSTLIDEMEYINSVGDPSGFYPERLEDFLAWLPEEYLVNIDRAWNYFFFFLFTKIIKNSGKVDQLLFKSPVDEKPLSDLNNCDIPFLYMAIINNKEQVNEVLQYDNLNLVGFELIVKDEGSDLIDQKWRKKLLEKNYILTVNSEKLGKRTYLYLDLSDQEALLSDSGYEVWENMLAHGSNAFITDWPNFMNEFRNSRKL